MVEYLLFRLYGPMAAWGRVAVGEVRGSDAYPSKSAVLGLLAAALGLRREDEPAHERLATGYGFAVRVDASGMLLRDYHTVQVPGQSHLKKRPHFTRRDELSISREDLHTILSTREYRCDGLYTIALWIRDTAPHPLGALQAALEQPRFPLYLGRKSCPLALPLEAQVIEASDLATAFTQARFQCDSLLQYAVQGHEGDLLDRVVEPTLHWEADLKDTAQAKGLDELMTVVRRDRLRSRRRWQYAERRETQGRIKPSKE